MPRHGRINIEGGVYHVIEWRKIFVDEADREEFVRRLAKGLELIGHKELGKSGVELSKYFEITRSSISEAIVRGRKIANENKYLIS